MFKLFGISVAFVSTKSGLLRWQDINTIDEKYADLSIPICMICHICKYNSQVCMLVFVELILHW